MKTQIRLLFIFIVLTITSNAQQFEWLKKYHIGNAGEFYCVVVTGDHNYLASGSLNNVGCVTKTDTAGNLIWSKSYSYFRDIYQVQETSDGGLAFYTSKNSNSGMILVKTNSSGDTLWSRAVNSFHIRNNKNFQQTNDGGYIVACSSGDTMYLKKLNSSGNITWTKYFLGLNQAFANSVSQTSDHGYLIGANTNSSSPANAEQDAYIVRTDEQGNLLWSYIYPMPGHQELMDIVQVSNNQYVFVFSYYSGCDGLTYLHGFSPPASNLWEHEIMAGSYSSWPWALYKTIDNGFIVAGYMQHLLEGTNFDYTISKSNSQGIEDWVINYNGPYSDGAYSVAQESDSTFITSGHVSITSSSNYTHCLAKINFLSITTGIQEDKIVNSFVLVPNPASGVFTVSLPKKAKRILVLNSIGQFIQDIACAEQPVLSLSIDKPGIYFVQVQIEDQTITKKMIIY